MKKFLIAFCLSLPCAGFAQSYDVSLVPDSLKENAVAIMRYEEIKVIIESSSKAKVRHKWAITILDEAGARFASYTNMYSSMQDLSDISGDLYDAMGRKLKSVKRKDIADVPQDDGFSLMRDSRLKYHSFNYSQYPYTVEYSDEVDMNGILGFPSWSPVKEQKYAVQESHFIIEAPLDYGLRYKQVNYHENPVVTKEKIITHTWHVKNCKPLLYEPYQPYLDEIVPAVYAAPVKFSYGGVEGDMSTWLNFGKYQVELNKGRDVLPDNIKQEVHKIVNGLTGKTEKIKALYQYLQNNTRYISIQLGIGGLQPFDAKYVATNRYGDCKALSNYMKALLKEAGIESYYSIIRAGEGEKFYMPDFVSDQTNHIIVSVPLGKDTMWLECTDQTKAAGYMGSFTDDRYALLIKDDGGYLVKTPAYGKKDNSIRRHVHATVDDQGHLSADVAVVYTGLEQDDLQGMINAVSHDRAVEILKRSIDLPTYDVSDVNYKESKDIIPLLTEKYKLTANNYVSATGKRLFLVPNVLAKEAHKLPEVENRRFDIVYDFSFMHLDTATIKIPTGYSIEAMPKDIMLKNKFGEFETRFKADGENVIFYRRYERSAGRFPPSDYKELSTFYGDMFKADHARIVFVKKEV